MIERKFHQELYNVERDEMPEINQKIRSSMIERHKVKMVEAAVKYK